MGNQSKDKPANWPKIGAILTVAVILIGFNYGVWTGNIVPNDISAKFLAQMLISMFSVLLVLTLVVLNKKGWV